MINHELGIGACKAGAGVSAQANIRKEDWRSRALLGLRQNRRILQNRHGEGWGKADGPGWIDLEGSVLMGYQRDGHDVLETEVFGDGRDEQA